MSENTHFEAPMAQAGHAPASSRGSSPDNDYLDVPGQRALPTTPARGRDATNRATPPSKRSDSEDDVSMNDIAMSTRESSASGTTTPGGRKRAKKQPQRFCCTQFAPCSLTFTRSEHLARHIRKHTGERPFQCHCGRRFSRLDNLRQHSQTVHANEEIPADSLANTGGRGPYARDRKAILSRQNARPMQPLQQQQFQQGPPSGRHIGHRRNVHSMPVNQMAPMYGNYHDPRGAPTPSQMMDPRGPAFTYGQPVNRYCSPEPYQSPAAYNTPPSNRSSGNFGEYYQEPNHQAGFSFPMRNDATYGAPLRRQSISSATGPYFDMPMRGSMSGPQLPPLHSGVRESFHHQSTNMFEQSPISTAPSEHSQYSPYARREESYHPMSEDPRRRTWHAGSYQRETYQLSQLSGGMHSMNITPPEEVRDRAYSYATRDNDSVHLPPIRTLEETPLSPYRREPSPYQMEMRAAEAPAQAQEQVIQVDPSLRSETERSAADVLASMGRRID